MFLIHCPYCNEARTEEEFHAAGEGHIQRPVDADATTDQQWGEYLFFRKNPRGVHRELWQHHIGCRKFFYILRNTETYQIYQTYKIDETVADPNAENNLGDLA